MRCRWHCRRYRRHRRCWRRWNHCARQSASPRCRRSNPAGMPPWHRPGRRQSPGPQRPGRQPPAAPLFWRRPFSSSWEAAGAGTVHWCSCNRWLRRRAWCWCNRRPGPDSCNCRHSAACRPRPAAGIPHWAEMPAAVPHCLPGLPAASNRCGQCWRCSCRCCPHWDSCSAPRPAPVRRAGHRLQAVHWRTAVRQTAQKPAAGQRVGIPADRRCCSYYGKGPNNQIRFPYRSSFLCCGWREDVVLSSTCA